MEVRGSYQHKFELRELSRRLGGYRIVIDEDVPAGEIHAITKYPVHIASGGKPGRGGCHTLVDKQVIKLPSFAECA